LCKEDPQVSTRIAFSARFDPRERANLEKRFAEGPPFDPEQAGFDRHAVYLGDQDIVFLFEGEDPLPAVRKLTADRRLMHEAVKMAGTVKAPRMLEEVYSWHRSEANAGNGGRP
jgi:hypothetical protein